MHEIRNFVLLKKQAAPSCWNNAACRLIDTLKVYDSDYRICTILRVAEAFSVSTL